MQTSEQRLVPIGAMEWQAHPDAPVVVPARDRDGVLLGSGEGTVRGAHLNGSLRFSMYSAECPMDPGFLDDLGTSLDDLDDHVCRVTPGGVIQSDDGARIQFDVQGFGLRIAKPAVRWTLTGAIRFATESVGHAWLNRVMGVWEGQFFEQDGSARYEIHARVPDLSAPVG